jgi:hypothetical protein
MAFIAIKNKHLIYILCLLLYIFIKMLNLFKTSFIIYLFI